MSMQDEMLIRYLIFLKEQNEDTDEKILKAIRDFYLGRSLK